MAMLVATFQIGAGGQAMERPARYYLLLPREAIRVRNQKQIRELARRFLRMVKEARDDHVV
jgi:hypothetical protein